MKIRNKKTGQIIEVQPNQLGDYGIYQNGGLKKEGIGPDGIYYTRDVSNPVYQAKTKGYDNVYNDLSRRIYDTDNEYYNNNKDGVLDNIRNFGLRNPSIDVNETYEKDTDLDGINETYKKYNPVRDYIRDLPGYNRRVAKGYGLKDLRSISEMTDFVNKNESVLKPFVSFDNKLEGFNTGNVEINYPNKVVNYSENASYPFYKLPEVSRIKDEIDRLGLSKSGITTSNYNPNIKGSPVSYPRTTSSISFKDDTPPISRGSLSSINSQSYPINNNKPNIQGSEYNFQGPLQPVNRDNISSLNNVKYPLQQSKPNIQTQSFNVPQQNIPRNNESLQSINSSVNNSQIRPNILGKPINYNPLILPTQSISRNNVQSLNTVSSTLSQYKPSITGQTFNIPQQPEPIDNSPKIPLDIYDRRGKFLRQEQIRRDDHGYAGRHHYSPRGKNGFIDVNAPINYQVGGTFYDQLLQQNKPIIDANRPIINRLSQQPQIDQIKKQEALAKQIANYDRTFSKSQGETPVSKLKAKQLNSSYVYSNPYSQLDENGNIAPIANDRDLQGAPKFGTQAYRTDDGMKNIMHGLDAAMLVEGIGHLGYKGLRNLGEYATTKTPLKNTHKINPWKFKASPNAYYHRSPNIENIINKKTGNLQGFGQSDAGKLFNESAGPGRNPNGGINLKKAANDDVFYSKGIPLDYGRYNSVSKGMSGQGYPGPFIVEVENVPMVSSSQGKRKLFAPSNLEGYATSTRPVNSNEVKFYKEHWLKGYKEVPKPKTNFKSEIDWSKWNTEIPNNTQLMNEYNTIEQTTKANGTWMKNPDGSIFEGTPEQFVQQNSSNFKKAFPNPILNDVGNVQYNYHGSPNKLTYFDERKAKPSMFGQGVYTSYDKNTGKYYLQNNPEGELYELYINSNKPQNTITRKDFYDYKNKQKNLIEKSRNTSDESLKENIYEEIKKLDKEWGIKYNKNLENQYLNDNSDFLRVGENQVTPFSNYLKSAIGNNGMFDMTNPNIYKALFPTAIGVGALQQKQLGGKINDNNGYLTSNLHNFTPKKIINSNYITTQGMAFPIKANNIILHPNTGDYIFPTNKVVEKPLYQNKKLKTIKKIK